MKKIILLLALFSTLIVSGCISNITDTVIGGDRDEHGCINTAGYRWCEAKEKCLRTWEEPCPGMVTSFRECKALGYTVLESYPRQCSTPKGEIFTENIEEPGYDDYENSAEGQAVEIALFYVRNTEPYKKENGKDLNIINILQARCPGCWQISLQYDLDLEKPTDIYTNDRMTINLTLNDWTVVSEVSKRGSIISLTLQECESKGGRVVNTLGETCTDDEKNIGDVKGLFCPCICCKALSPGSEIGLTREECIKEGGRIINTTNEYACSPDDINIGQMKGFAYLHLCCVPFPESEKLTIDEAKEIAQNTECTEKGNLTDNYMYNENSKTWWIDLDMKDEFEKEYCNPACVVYEYTKTAEINWRCMGLMLTD
ncbi:MAG: hypothetical protein U9P44_03740 [archaeon]|nr:hypothetical protein [archaeon]